MKRHLAPALFSLSLCAVMGGVRTAGAQALDGGLVPTADSASVATSVAATPVALDAGVPAPIASPARTAVPILAANPIMLATTGVRPADARIGVDATPVAAPPRVDWKMPTSRALMIGGATTALIGVLVVGSDAGAIIGLTGTAVAVYGLYLHYNR